MLASQKKHSICIEIFNKCVAHDSGCHCKASLCIDRSQQNLAKPDMVLLEQERKIYFDKTMAVDAIFASVW